MAEHSHEIGVKTILARELAYLTDEDRYVELNEVPYRARVSSISGTQVREEYWRWARSCPSGSLGRRWLRFCSGQTRGTTMRRPARDVRAPPVFGAAA